MRARTWRARPVAALLGVAAAWGTSVASAAPTLREQVTQRGGFALVGNTFGHDCGAAATPIVGEVGTACGTFIGDPAPDVVWRSDVPAAGQARADHAFAVTDARTAAVLALPAGAMVTRAFLYWAASLPVPDGECTLRAPGGETAAATAIETFTSSVVPYVGYASVADVTEWVRRQGTGAYHVSDVDLPEWRDANDQVGFGAWWMVVLYEVPTGGVRHLAVFDGLDAVLANAPQTALLDGLDVPGVPQGALGVVGLAGDQASGGDGLALDGTSLGDATNPFEDVFNGSRAWLGEPVHRTGDLPEMSGAAGSLVGLDLDVFDLAPALFPGASSSSITATTTGGSYWLATLVSSIAARAPSFVDTVKSASDVDGAPTQPGDTIEFSIQVRNTGDAPAGDVVLVDELVPDLAFVPGSLTIDGEGATEAAGDDRFDFDAPTTSLTVRLGVGASATSGGTLAAGASTTVVFLATVDPDARGVIANQAIIAASGGPDGTWPSGSPEGPGLPTTIVVDDCVGGACGGGGEGGGADGGGGAGGDATSSTTAASASAGPTSASSATGGAPAEPVEDVTFRGSGITCAAGTASGEGDAFVLVLAIAAVSSALRRQKDHAVAVPGSSSRQRHRDAGCTRSAPP